MSRSPRVSVVVPHYNESRLLRETIRSVEAQSFTDWEIVIVDDGSTPEHRRVIAPLAGPRVRIVEQTNQGPAAASQRAMDLARGTYIAFLDHDDLWHPAKLEQDVRALDEHPELDLVFCGFQWIDDVGEPIAAPHRAPAERFDARALCIDYCIGPTATVTIRASAARAAGPMNPLLRRYYDFEFFLRVASLRPANVGASSDVLAYYRRHAGQLSADVALMRAEWQHVLDAVRQCPGVDEEVVAHAQSNMHRYFAFLQYEHEHFLSGLGLLGQAFRFSPWAFLQEPRNWLAGSACVAGLLLPPRVRAAAQRMVARSMDSTR